jgi:hypothetical protein
MKGRYYSPLWHRFINSDQGVDPNSINQYAYVGGSPFMATDPSGMLMSYYCIVIEKTVEIGNSGTSFPYNPEIGGYSATVTFADASEVICFGYPAGGGGGLAGGWSGGGSGGSGAPKIGQLWEVTKEDCGFIRDLLRKAKTDGQRAAAKWAFDNGEIVNRYTNNPANNYSNLMPTKYGGMDFDWYITMSIRVPQTSSKAVNMIMGHLSYIGGKSLWDFQYSGSTSIQKSEGPYRFEWPYRDPGERVAVRAFAAGATFADLFDQAWFDMYCRGK